MLTNKQSKFIEAYKQLNNGPQAAISAGYSAKSASIEACRLLKHPAILLELDNWRKERQKEFSKKDFIDYALADYKAVDINEANRPRFLQLAGQGAGIIGSNTESSTTTNNIQINAVITDGKSLADLWESARKMIEQS